MQNYDFVPLELQTKEKPAKTKKKEETKQNKIVTPRRAKTKSLVKK